eukprot:12654193-Alexandrium_andersonii.AAC.1
MALGPLGVLPFFVVLPCAADSKTSPPSFPAIRCDLREAGLSGTEHLQLWRNEFRQEVQGARAAETARVAPANREGH